MDLHKEYTNVINYLYDRLPMFSRIGKAAIKNDLSNTIKLCNSIGNPQNKFKSIHIAGTNGKGSTSHALAAILQDAGYKTGLYTSPHLIDFRERIRINGEMVARQVVIAFVEKYKYLIEEINPSFFEITVAIAFLEFANQKVDIAIIETGLGGRLDSTNIITPLLSVITNISYDHQDLLGNTLTQIATEKAGIIKPGIPVVIGERDTESETVFLDKAKQENSPIYFAESIWDIELINKIDNCHIYNARNLNTNNNYVLKTDLAGNYQQHNLKTILSSSELLANLGFKIEIEKAIQALETIKSATGLMGRWDSINTSPTIICDVAHNAAGLKEVLLQWENINAAKKYILVGFVKDKDVELALSNFPKDNTYYFCNAMIPRALPAQELYDIAQKNGLKGSYFQTVESALEALLPLLSKEDALLITGSFFIVGEALDVLKKGDY